MEEKLTSLFHHTIVSRENQLFHAKNTQGEIKMKQEEIRKYIQEMLDRADMRVLRIIYRVLIGLK